jgi:diaminohydroxyphosphoribosylaminopyrimidine deaminase/5-amino-6-(5-phosphoribosylamino)uracil reductase
VVCAIEDPNPEISGRGLAVLRAAGVAVDLGLCAQEARWMAAGHILRMTRDRPFVQLKIAVSGDGLIAPGDGAPRWVTGPEARRLAHILRARADAILVGRKTVADDDPELTCRLPGLDGRSPRRVVVDAKFRTRPDAKMVTRVLVEGGPTIAGAILAADLVDEVVIGHGTEALGSKGRKPAGEHGLEFLEDTARWQTVDDRMIGADRLTVHRRVGRFAASEAA